MDKVSARNQALDNIAKLSPKERFISSATISKKFIDFVNEKNIKTVFIYMSVSGEVSTLPIISALFEMGCDVYIPKIVGDILFATKIEKNTPFILNKYKIPEAPSCGDLFYSADINVIPLVAFDKDRNRVGHGKGYYDKYLSKASGESIALAFSAQEVASIDATDLDIKPSIIITEKEVIK